jgi:hypothetical protein
LQCNTTANELAVTKSYYHFYVHCNTTAYELAVGIPPFRSSSHSPKELQRQIAEFSPENLKFPPFVSDTFKTFVRALLNPAYKERLGSSKRDSMDVMEHPWFAETDFLMVQKKTAVRSAVLFVPCTRVCVCFYLTPTSAAPIQLPIFLLLSYLFLSHHCPILTTQDVPAWVWSDLLPHHAARHANGNGNGGLTAFGSAAAMQPLAAAGPRLMGHVTVEVLNAKDLISTLARERAQLPNTLCTVVVDSQRRSTGVVSETTDPVWNETFSFQVKLFYHSPFFSVLLANECLLDRLFAFAPSDSMPC